MATDHLDDVDPTEKLLDEVLRNHPLSVSSRRAAQREDRRLRTMAETAERSALPASRCLTIAITCPI